MTLNIKDIIKKNVKFIGAMIIIIILGIFGISYALKVAVFNKIAVNINSANMDVNITYDSGVNGSNISNAGNLLPIDDSLVTGPTVSDSRVLKAKFYVTGTSSNPENSIYDVAIHDFDVDCELRTEDLKWRLYKNGTLLSSGNLSPTFDTISNNRLVLTDTQQDLTTTKDEYVFLLWISESCSGDIATCSKEQDQSKYFNKSLSGSIKVELATKSKKNLVRTTGVSGSCNYTVTNTPTCNTLTYNGSEQTLVTSGDNYTVSNSVGTNAGDYAVTVKLKDGYKWNDGSTNDKVLNCSIDRKRAVVTADNQTIKYGSSIEDSKYTVSNLISGHSVKSVYLDPNINKVGTGTIVPTNVKIVDSSNNDVTNNYDFNYVSGVLTINCLNTATPPTVGDKKYTGSSQTGVSGGSNIDLTGTSTATNIGNYTVSAVPKTNYCWTDGTTTKRDYSWKIKDSAMFVTLSNKEADYTGSAINIDAPIIKNAEGEVITGPNITYTYYNGGSCSGTALSGAPSNAGSYSVRAVANAFDQYAKSDSNCATLTINKVASTLTAEVSTTLKYGTASVFTYNLNPTGTVTCSTNNSKVATCSVDNTNKKVTITPVGLGTTVITISGTPSNNNYYSSSINKSITINCSNTATEPSAVTGLTYNGSSQIGLKGGSNVDLSTTSAINAGSYTGKATPKTNYCWTDGTTTTKSYSWSIAKKNVTCSISSVPSLKYPGSTSGTIKYNCTDSKTPSVTSSDTSAITVSNVTSTTASLNALKIGSSTISVYTASNSNYNASNKATTNITTSASTYTLTYDNNGGSGCSSSTMTYGSTYGTMCEPSRNGYIFIGWFDTSYKDKALYFYADTYADLKNAFGYDQDALYNHYLSYGKGEGRRISQYISTDTYTTNGNQTIYAGWYPKSYTISYNSSDGSGTMSSDTVKSGGSVTIKANTFTRTGYRFLGWTTNSDGTDDGYGWTGWGGTWAYDNGQYGISNNSLVLYARWQQNKVTIKLNPNGGTVTANTSKGGTYAINSAGNITRNGSDVFHTIKYGNSLGSSGLANYNNENYLYINKDNYYAFPETAWICKSGCTTANKVFDQGKTYKSTDFCDASSNDCTVVLEVNWMKKDVINGYRCHFGDNGVYYISFCSNDGKSAEESSDQCIYTERFYSDSSGSHSDYTSGVIMRNTLNGYSCYTDTINGNRCNDNGTYYVTTCSEVDCNYTKFNGANETGLVVRNSLKANCGTPEHTHVWKARGIRKFSIGQSTKFSCGSYHASGLAVYCSVCGMSKDYYNANIAHVSEKFLCPDNPYGSPNGWKILDDCSITTRNELKNISGGTNMFSETTSNSC